MAPSGCLISQDDTASRETWGRADDNLKGHLVVHRTVHSRIASHRNGFPKQRRSEDIVPQGEQVVDSEVKVN
jgi:hypothetical protein